jgi:hypothetical protein
MDLQRRLEGRSRLLNRERATRFGVVYLMNVIGPLTMGDLVGSNHLPESEREEFRKTGLSYRKTFGRGFRIRPAFLSRTLYHSFEKIRRSSASR